MASCLLVASHMLKSTWITISCVCLLFCSLSLTFMHFFWPMANLTHPVTLWTCALLHSPVRQPTMSVTLQQWWTSPCPTSSASSFSFTFPGMTTLTHLPLLLVSPYISCALPPKSTLKPDLSVLVDVCEHLYVCKHACTGMFDWDGKGRYSRKWCPANFKISVYQGFPFDP